MARLFALLPIALQVKAATPYFPLSTSECAPVSTQSAFDLSTFASKRWYAQQQMATLYLPASENYCVYADYTVLPKPTLLGYTVQVHNYAQEKDGKTHDSGKIICAKGTDSSDPAKLEVGPCFLPRISGFSTGPYWVLAYDEQEGYALISGGQPTHKADSGCRTGAGVNGAGLWIFTRQQQRDENLVQKVRSIALAKGFDLTVLNNVDQSTCGHAAQQARGFSNAEMTPVPFLSTRASSSTCATVATQPGFDLDLFASKRWYAQQQMPTLYLPETENYCVYAEYAVLSKPTLLGYTVQVHNYAREKDGKTHDSGKIICAKGTDSSDPAKLEVGPCFLPRISGFSTGPYWVLAYSEQEGYALVSGGQPTHKSSTGCRTGTGVNGAGLWIFTRQQQRDETILQKVRNIASAKGFDLSVLNNVDQTSCGNSIDDLIEV